MFSWLVLWIALTQVFVSWSNASQQAECNVCGCDGCIMGNPQGQVTYLQDGRFVTKQCQTLFHEVITERQLSWGCGNAELWEVVREPCACRNAKGVLLKNDGK